MSNNPFALDSTGLSEGLAALGAGLGRRNVMNQQQSAATDFINMLNAAQNSTMIPNQAGFVPGVNGSGPTGRLLVQPPQVQNPIPEQPQYPVITGNQQKDAQVNSIMAQLQGMSNFAPKSAGNTVPDFIPNPTPPPTPAQNFATLVSKYGPVAANGAIESITKANQAGEMMQNQQRLDNFRRIILSNPNLPADDKAFITAYPQEYMQAKMQGLNIAKIWAEIQHTQSGTEKNIEDTKKLKNENAPLKTEVDANGTIIQTQPGTGKQTVVNPQHERAVAQSLSPTKVLMPDGTYVEGTMDKRDGTFRAGKNGDGPIITGINKIPEAENAKLISNAAVRNDMTQVLDPANKADIIAITGVLNGSGLTKLKSMIDSDAGGLTERQKYLGSKMLDAQQRYEFSATGASGNTDLRVKALMDNLNNKMTYESLMGGYKAGQDSLYKVLEETVKNAQTNRQAVPSEYVDELQKIGRLNSKSTAPANKPLAQGLTFTSANVNEYALRNRLTPAATRQHFLDNGATEVNK